MPPARGSTKTRRVSPPAASRSKGSAGRPPTLPGWQSNDEHEIAVRRWRGRTLIASIESLEPREPVFGAFRTRSDSGSEYVVEIRSLTENINSCECADHRVNGLGSCKHVEGVLAALTRRRSLAAMRRRGLKRVEIFVDRRGRARPSIGWPAIDKQRLAPIRDLVDPFLDSGGKLTVDPVKLDALVREIEKAPEKVRRRLRVSRGLEAWLDRERRRRERDLARAAFLNEVERGEASLDILKMKLLPYQREGMLHLAFNGRALLADDMGLGKTIQAIAACEILARRQNAMRALIVCPASLKGEWEEQIARFSERAASAVFGGRRERLDAYRAPTFFTIVNYEQVVVDADDINRLLAPDIVVLDEAQRIKNWQTKTARRVKSLRSRNAFVLTGTPIENRIDEIYSIVQYLDPELLGPLFRFNRDFYRLDERGRPVDYRNLAELRDRLKGVMLRRRKADVEKDLPGRTVKNFFIAMCDEQRLRYDEYRQRVARLVALAKRRPLTKAEFDMLQKWLACMRMICDTPAILEPECRVSPKLEELEGLLGELLAEPDRKIIIFSEWERMLAMVRDLAGELGIEAAWHTGSVPQRRRRAEIARFKEDPACRLFLSTDSGAVGLNLQAANAVINIDLPWNPAKLEQRIARAWRKGQKKSVNVFNLVCEDSIEHGILHLLDQKQALFDGVIDGAGDLSTLKMPSGRAVMIARLEAAMDLSRAPKIFSAEEALVENLRRQHGERLVLVEARRSSDGRERLLAILDGAETLDRRAPMRQAATPPFEVIDLATWRAIRRLAETGVLHFANAATRIVYRAEGFAGPERDIEGATETAVEAAAA